MLILKESRNLLRKRRHLRIRKRVKGTPERPRLSVFRSLRHIYAQVIDDTTGRTLASASTLDPELRDKVKGLRKTEASRLVGQLVAQRALERGITRVVFDRGGYLYHGRVKALAEGAREAGLEF
jgi:large subunit ribosomal protein L18